MASLILCVDQGTTGTRAVAYGRDLKPRGFAYLEHRQHFPKPGWVEHDAGEIWDNTLEVTRRALRAASVRPSAVAAVGITNQRETVVVWDGAGRPLHRAVVWQCRRSQEICGRLKKKGLEKIFKARTGLLLDPYFSGTKLAWLAENDARVAAAFRDGSARFGTMDSFLLHRMTGGAAHATDFTNASRTLLFDIHRRRWDPRLAALLKTPLACLPKVLPSAGFFGNTDPKSFAGVSAPVCGIAGDQQAALFGQGCWGPGEAKNTYGTGCFLLMNLGPRARAGRRGLLTTLACGSDGGPVFAFEGAVFIAGAAVQWLRDGLEILEDAAQSEALAASAPDSGGVVMVPALVGLGAPDWDPAARGALLGLTRGTGRAQVARAALEAIALQSAELADLMQAESGLRLKSLRVDGGATANRLLMGLQADLLGVPVRRAGQVESTALGAAALAALGGGLASGSQIRARLRARETVFRPGRGAAWRRGMKARYRAAVEAVKAFAHPLGA